MDAGDIVRLSVSTLSGLIERREVSPVEVAQAYLDRIDDVGFKFGAYLTVTRREALRAAREAEEAIGRGEYRGPMHGIPYAVKDQLWTEGVRTTGGSRILADLVPGEDAAAIANMKRVGAVMLGKTNMTEFAIVGASHRYGSPRNPWDLDRFTGGSSGGSAAAVGAFMCATSLGEDTGGSIRGPASWCGLVGLRPSLGRVSRYGLMRGVWSMDTVGPISRTVEDAAITLGAIAGHDPRDPYTWDAPVPDYRAALGGDLKGLRVGVVTDDMDDRHLTSPEVKDAILKAASVLGELGASVEELSMPLASEAGTISRVIMAVEPAFDQRDWVRERLQEYGHEAKMLLLLGSLIPAQAYYKAQKLRSMVRRDLMQSLERYDVLVTPTYGKTAPLIKDDVVIASKEMAVSEQPYLVRRIFNLANVPAVSIPCGFDSAGLPIGLQIGGRAFDEATVLRVAHAYEQATPWHEEQPREA